MRPLLLLFNAVPYLKWGALPSSPPPPYTDYSSSSILAKGYFTLMVALSLLVEPCCSILSLSVEQEIYGHPMAM